MKNRHEEEFIALARSNEKLIYKVCSFYVSPTAPVEDLYQEVIANLWHSWPRFRGESATSTWIYRVALNTCITYMRKGKKKCTHETPADNVPEPAADHDGGEDNVATLYKLINTLNDMDKAVILLAVVGFSVYLINAWLLFKMDISGKVRNNIKLIKRYKLNLQYEYRVMYWVFIPVAFVWSAVLYAKFGAVPWMWAFLIGIYVSVVVLCIYMQKKVFAKHIGQITRGLEELRDLKEDKE